MAMITLPGTPRPEKVTKLDAARRHLATAIALWFTSGDTVSIYTLSHAAYEVIHNITRGKRKTELLFDAPIIRDEYRKDFNSHLRNPANFFKHARREKSENQTIEFYPRIAELFFLFSIFGLSQSGIELNREERIFHSWLMIRQPQWFTEEGRKFISDRMPIESARELRRASRKEFYEAFLQAFRHIKT
jgi:hypothetical protein